MKKDLMIGTKLKALGIGILMLAFFTLIAVASKAQTGGNGGISAETSSIKVTYVSNVGGFTTIDVLNKQACDVTVEIRWNANTVVTQVIAGSTTTHVLIGVPLTDFKVKPLTDCGGGGYDNGWAELNHVFFSSLPVKFVNFLLTKNTKQ